MDVGGKVLSVLSGRPGWLRGGRLRMIRIRPVRGVRSAVNGPEAIDTQIVDPARLPFLYADALNAGDVDAVLALFHQDATMRTFTGKVLTGGEALRAETVQTIAAQAHLTNKPTSILTGGDTALITVDWDLEATAPDGTRISPTGTTTAVACRSADGSWRFTVLNCQGAVGAPGW
jgi:uncharacterized protein (TIGR02246 family)